MEAPQNDDIEENYSSHIHDNELEEEEHEPLEHDLDVMTIDDDDDDDAPTGTYEEQIILPRSKVDATDFEMISVLGKGGFGVVSLARKITGDDSGTMYAMKIVKKVTILRSEKDTTHTKAERSILETIRHPFIVHMQYAFQTSGRLYLILEFAQGGELFSLLEREHVFDDRWASFYLGEITLALGHLHDNGVIYRDLKPENVLLDKRGHVKLTDFGLCKQNIFGEDTSSTFCGTVEYMAPEVIKQRGHGKEVDWWSLGTLMYDMINGQPPFQGDTREETIKKVTHGRLMIYSHMTQNANDLIVKLLQRNRTRRLGYGQDDYRSIIKHSFFRNIDFTRLYNREVIPPYVPDITNPTDLQHFDHKFTGMPIATSPEQVPDPKLGDPFYGFTFTGSFVNSYQRLSYAGASVTRNRAGSYFGSSRPHQQQQHQNISQNHLQSVPHNQRRFPGAGDWHQNPNQTHQNTTVQHQPPSVQAAHPVQMTSAQPNIYYPHGYAQDSHIHPVNMSNLANPDESSPITIGTRPPS